MDCMFLSCPYEAVSSVFVDTDHQPSPLRVCWTHERDLVDRYGFEDVQPRPLVQGVPARFTVEQAVSFLQGGA